MNKMIIDKIKENINRLPDYLQVEVSDYVEYLLVKYQITSKQNDIPEEHKRILKERLKKMQENPNTGESWDTVKNELFQKYAL